MKTIKTQNIDEALSLALWEAPLEETSTARMWNKIQAGLRQKEQSVVRWPLQLIKSAFPGMVLIMLAVIVGFSLGRPENVFARIAHFFLPGVGLVDDGSENYLLEEPVVITNGDFAYILSGFVSAESKTWAKIKIEGIGRGEYENFIQSTALDLPYLNTGAGNPLDCTYWEAYYDDGLFIECQFPAIMSIQKPVQLVLPGWPAPFSSRAVTFPVELRKATASDMITVSESPSRSNTCQGISMSILQANHTSDSTIFVMHFDAPSLEEVILPKSLLDLQIKDSSGFALQIVDVRTVFPYTGRTFFVKTLPTEMGSNLQFSLDKVSLLYSAPGETGTELFKLTIPNDATDGKSFPVGVSVNSFGNVLMFESARLEKGRDAAYQLIFDVSVPEHVDELMLRCDNEVCTSAESRGGKLNISGLLHPSLGLSGMPHGELTVYLMKSSRNVAGSWNVDWQASSQYVMESNEGASTWRPPQPAEEIESHPELSANVTDNELAFEVRDLLQKGFTTAYSQPGWVYFSHEQIEAQDSPDYQSGRAFGERHSFTEWWVLLNEKLLIEKRITISKSADGSILLEEVQVGSEIYNKTLNLKSKALELSLIPHPETLDRDIDSLTALDNAKIDTMTHDGRPTRQVTIEYGYSQPTNWGNVLKPIVKVTGVTLIDEETGAIVQKSTSVTFEDGSSMVLFIDNYGIPTKVDEPALIARSLLESVLPVIDQKGGEEGK